MVEKVKKVSLLDWRFKLGIIFIVLSLVFLVISLILLATANFIGNAINNNYFGNGFWLINNYSLSDLLFHSTKLDDYASFNLYQSHPFYQAHVALILLIFIVSILLILGILLVIRWWVKTRI